MLAGRSYVNKDIQLNVIKSNNEGLSRIITQISSTKSSFTRPNEINPNQGKDSCIHTNRNLMKHTENTENLSRIGIPDSQSKTFWTKFQKIIFAKPSYWNLKYVKWPLVIIFICTCLGFFMYTSLNWVNRSQQLPIVNSSNSSIISALLEESQKNLVLNNRESSENSMDSKAIVSNGDMSDTVLNGSSTLLRPVIVSYPLTRSGFIKKTHIDESIKGSSIPNAKEGRTTYEKSNFVNLNEESFGEQDDQQNNNDKTEVLSIIGFTSGHQNNFGVPIEEDERILRLLNEKLIKLDQKSNPPIIDSHTESSLIVSPTLPLVIHEPQESSTRSELVEETLCQSTSLHMCRGVLQYDLTAATTKNLSFTTIELNSFERLFSSNCSSRVAEFVCSILEPECRPMQTISLQPCKRFCKSILEACSTLVVTSDILTYIFDCDKYPDSSDKNVCEDPTRRGDCYTNEFKCYDSSCIPSKWQCDNIKDCEGGDDELNCLVCNTDEFRCKSNEKCVPDQYRCDHKEDCSDGSDELDCEIENEHFLQVPELISFRSSLLPNYTKEFFNTIFDEDRLPAGSELNESVVSSSTIHGLMKKTDLVVPTSSSEYSTSLENLDSKDIMSSDTEKTHKTSETDSTEKKNNTVSTTVPTLCIDDQLRCVSGKCITVNQLCDRVVDCPEGEDEMMCGYDENQSQP